MRVIHSTMSQIKPGQLDAAIANAAEAAALIRPHGAEVRYFVALIAGEAVNTAVFTSVYESPEAMGKAFDTMTSDPAIAEYAARAFGPDAPTTIVSQTVSAERAAARSGRATHGTILETHVNQIHPGRDADFVANSIKVCDFVEAHGATNASVLQLTYAGAATGLGTVTWELEDMRAQATLANAWISTDGVALQAKVNESPASTLVSSAMYRSIAV